MSISFIVDYRIIFCNEFSKIISMIMLRFFGIRRRKNRSTDYNNLETVAEQNINSGPNHQDDTPNEVKHSNNLPNPSSNSKVGCRNSSYNTNRVGDIDMLTKEKAMLQEELNKNLENERLTKEILQLELETLQCKRNRAQLTREIEALERYMKETADFKNEDDVLQETDVKHGITSRFTTKIHNKSPGQITLLIMRHAPNDWKKFRNIQNKSDALNLKNELEERQLAIEGLRSRVTAKLNQYMAETEEQGRDDVKLKLAVDNIFDHYSPLKEFNESTTTQRLGSLGILTTDV